MSLPGQYIELIAGALDEPAVVLDGRLEDSDDGSLLGPQRASADGAVQDALATAHAAWAGGSWSGLELEDRADALERLAAELDRRAETIALLDAVDSGVPLAVTAAIAGSLGDLVRSVVVRARVIGDVRALDAGGRRVEVLRLPWGPALLLTPFNAPAPTAVGKLANALAAGCPAILKPSEHAPSSAGQIAEAAVAAELPPGALQIVHGGADVARQLVADPRVRVISLTGGQAAGRSIAAAAAPRMAAMQLELGGSNPSVVTDDADVIGTAAALAAGMTKLNGQWCEAPRRVLVDRRRHDDLVDALREALAAIRIGPARAPDTELGPLSHRAQRDSVRRRVAMLGGEAIPTAPVPDGPGLFESPTLVTGLAADAVDEEIFGPVLTLHPIEGDTAAIAAANATGDGLAAYVFAGGLDRAFDIGRSLHAGEVRIGGTHLLDLAPGSTQSFWGSSGIGAHGDAEVFEAYRGSRIVGEEDPGLPI